MKGMIFDGESVRQIIAGNKTQSRRIMKRQPHGQFQGIKHDLGFSASVGKTWAGFGEAYDPAYYKPRYDAGETVYVKESYAIYGVFGSTTHYHYKADGALSLDYKTPLFMPESLSRIKLRIVRVGIEHVRNITIEDIKKEGVQSYDQWQARWIEVNGQASWDANPWVWVYEFVRV